MTRQGRLLTDDDEVGDGSTVFINARCRLQTQDRYRVVSVCGMVLSHYAVDDRMGEAHAMVSLVEQGWAKQNEVARAFACSERTVRRHQQRFEAGGLAALGRPSGYPRGRPRLPESRIQRVERWKGEGISNREIARRLGVNDKAVRKLLRRLGWKPEPPEQLAVPLEITMSEPSMQGEATRQGRGEAADPNLSGVTDRSVPPVTARRPQAGGSTNQKSPDAADPNLSASADHGEFSAVSFDSDPSDRQVDRLLACMGLLDDAAPIFRPATKVAGSGVLLAIPALIDSGVFDIARELYGSIGPAFYGLRTTLVTLLLMALLRIKRPEGLKEHAPQDLGRLLGLDRAPEVKTLRRKLARLTACGCAAQLGRQLAERRVKTHGHALGFLYVDGHVRAYHGKRVLPKTHVARMRLSMPATTDYWVNDAEGEPLFVVTTEANKGLVKMLPIVLKQVRALVGERRVTVVFDRGGWSPKLFQQLISAGFDILTYRKGRFRRVAKKKFSVHEEVIDGRKVSYTLADQAVLLLKRKLRLRQVTRQSDDGHQTPIITSRRDLPAIEVAYRMFERWRQENFFKYLREEYALDALVDYGIEPADPERSVPNPERKRINAELRKLYAELRQLATQYGVEALTNRESVRRTMRGFKIANAPLSGRIVEVMENIMALEKKRAKVPTRVPVKQVVEGEVVKLAVERKHLTDLIKMVAYQAESDLLRLVAPHYRRLEDEGRTLIHSALAAVGDIDVTDTELRVTLEPLSSPHRTRALAALCDQLNETATRFPGSRLRLHFDVKPEPASSLAFPGPRLPKGPVEVPKPDILSRG
jgi:prepilin-type processing-associated H-X9-DG protein